MSQSKPTPTARLGGLSVAGLAVPIGVVGIVLLVKAKSTPPIPPAMAPNWYPDPDDPELLRYFDGQSWTETTQPRDAPPG